MGCGPGLVALPMLVAYTRRAAARLSIRASRRMTARWSTRAGRPRLWQRPDWRFLKDHASRGPDPLRHVGARRGSGMAGRDARAAISWPIRSIAWRRRAHSASPMRPSHMGGGGLPHYQGDATRSDMTVRDREIVVARQATPDPGWRVGAAVPFAARPHFALAGSISLPWRRLPLLRASNNRRCSPDKKIPRW
jgi:hypothetical protein